MIKSMTGYGKAIAETSQKKITFEIKSLNSKQLDINTKIPWLYKEKEPEIRNIINQKLDRGKIDLTIYFDILEDEVIPVINKSVVRNYYAQLKEIAEELRINLDDQILTTIMKLPDALKTEKPELSQSEWNLASHNLIESINILDLYRAEEGKSIESDLRKCLSGIISALEQIEKFEPGRITKVREKLIAILEENTGTENIDKNRFEQELIFYLEKYDFNEEKVRLRKHCEYFLETIDSPSPNGKTLSFIAQEMGREINTIGSKANDASIQKLVVMMKDELEKIKEQTLNIL
ncbi:MAG TPA: DUF1732 domain-containing protein [Bacteroidales bacterium]|nr:DUF1732 domain-containing protein [Bacteroidales bacterium]